MTTNIIRRYAVSGDIAYPIHEDPEGEFVTYEDHVAAIEADRKQKGEVVVTKTPEGEIIAVTRQDAGGKILSVIAEADRNRWGEPVPKGWKLVPETPTSKQIVHMACQIKGADADGWFRTDGDDWPEHVDAAERAYKWALSEAPQPTEPVHETARTAGNGAESGVNTGPQGGAHSASSYSRCGCNSDDCRVNGCLSLRQAQSAMAPGGGGIPAVPVKSYLTVKYDEKGDCLYVYCDSNEPSDAEEDDKGILYRRAISDGRLVGITIMNFMGRHAESSDDVPQPAEPYTSDYQQGHEAGWQDCRELYEPVLEDHRRLVRELDVLLNDEDGAAEQASLCDIVAQVRREGIKAAEPVKVPSDGEIESLAKEHMFAHAQFVGAGEVWYEGEVEFARALLAKYGQGQTRMDTGFEGENTTFSGQGSGHAKPIATVITHNSHKLLSFDPGALDELPEGTILYAKK